MSPNTLVEMRVPLLVLAAFAVAGVGLMADSRRIVEDDSPAPGCRYSAHLTGDQEVTFGGPDDPGVPTVAQGQFSLVPSPDETTATFTLMTSRIENVVAAHLHLAPVGQNGPVVVPLLGPLASGGGPSQGLLAEGTIGAASLGGPLASQPFSALLTALKHGVVYVNVHTNDGIDPANTAPGDFPGGEIRGQVRPMSGDCGGPLFYYWYTCGDPLCFGFHDDPAIPLCTTQQAGTRCFSHGEVCEVGDCENHRIVCQREDPTAQYPCPISLTAFKRDIRYLDEDAVRRLHDEIVSYRLATYRYRSEGEESPLHLGFMIDDVGPALSVGSDGRTVDLYGYTSMAVAAVQQQARQIRMLTRRIEALETKPPAAQARED